MAQKRHLLRVVVVVAVAVVAAVAVAVVVVVSCRGETHTKKCKIHSIYI